MSQSPHDRADGNENEFASTIQQTASQSNFAFDERNSKTADGFDEVLEACLEALANTGGVADPAELLKFRPELEEPLDRFVLVELIKLDMSIKAESGEIQSLETYLEALAEKLPRSEVPIDLVMEEIQLRREVGEQPDCDEYRDRFPHLAEMLSQLEQPVDVTATVSKRRQLTELRSGTQIDDFLVIQELGRGAFAQVVLARQLSMHRLVALKVSGSGGDEPLALARLDHPNIVRVYDQRLINAGTLHLLYMQYHPGGTLEDVVRCVRQVPIHERHGRLLLDCIDMSLLHAAQVIPDRSATRDWLKNIEWPMLVAWVGMQVLRGLQAAHDQQVLHRDIKPANVLLTADGIPQLADFNVSFSGAAGRAGAAAFFGGTIGYMAPEHLKAISAQHLKCAGRVTESADIYSAGILLWELWQGQRPFECPKKPCSWAEAVEQQFASRSLPLISPERTGSSCERVLETILRLALSNKPEERPDSAAEMAGRLRLAMHSEAANLFDPDKKSLADWLGKCSPWLVAGSVMLIPNIAAGWFNYEYNRREVTVTDEMAASLSFVSICINCVVYPLGMCLMFMYSKPLFRALRVTRSGEQATEQDIDAVLDLGHRAAIIGGAFWMIAGVVYPCIMKLMYREFTTLQAIHFFASLLICGAIAMIYPLFSLAWISSYIYYPRLLRATVHDQHFERRRTQMLNRCEGYLQIAVIIPLLGLTLLVTSRSSSQMFMLTAIGAGLLGLIASFHCYRIIVKTWNRLADVLANQTLVSTAD